MPQLSAVQVTGSGSTLLVSALGRHEKAGLKQQRAPKLAAYRSDPGSPIKASSEPRDDGAPDRVADLREIVIQRSRNLSSVECRPLALPLGPPKELTLPVSGLQRLARVLSESFLVARLAVKLFSYVGFGGRWICAFLQLLAYALMLMPGFIQMVAFYYLSPRVMRGVRYGPQSRNVLDIYVPPNHWDMTEGLRPVVVYVTGGAWTIGYKAWGALLSKRLSEAGVLVCCLDYRNFPQGTALDMIEDINHGICWVLDKVAQYGGDPNQVYICGQSCGGHLASLAVLTQAEQQGLGQPVPGGSPAWDVSKIRAFIGVSGVYNVHDLVDHFDRRGLYKSLFLRIMSIHETPQLKLLSPVYVAAHSLQQAAAAAGGDSSDCEAADEGAPLLRGVQWGGKRSSDSPEQRFLHAESAAALHGAGQGLGHGAAKEVGRAFPGSSASSLMGTALGDEGQDPPSLTPAPLVAAAAMAATSTVAPPEADGLEVVVDSVAGAGKAPAELMPHMLLLHGDADRCAPVQGAEQFAHALRDAGVPVTLKLYKGETHTSPLLENPMCGGQDALTDDILSLVFERQVSNSYPSLCPHFLIRLAAKVCPF